MGITEAGLRLAMLDTLRTEDERILDRRQASLSVALVDAARADKNLRDALKDVQFIRQRIAQTTLEMNRIVERGKP